MKGFNKGLWALLAIVGAACLGVVALRRGEQISASACHQGAAAGSAA